MFNSQLNLSPRAVSLADRIEQGAATLASFADGLTASEWQTPVPGDGRSIGVVVHHVASSYPMEVELAQTLASGKPITGATNEVVDQINATHARDFAQVGKQETQELLRRNSKAAADAVRVFSDEELDTVATVSLNANAPLSAQFFIEDHALRHSFHHLARMQAALTR